MKCKVNHIIILFVINSVFIFPQSADNKFSISLNYNYTTTSRLYLQPNSSDPFLRNLYNELEDIYSISAEFRFEILEDLLLGLGGEFITKTFPNQNFNLGGRRIEIKDGFSVIPVELSIYYLLPFSTQRFKFFMGGGGGIYFGKHIREFGDVFFENEKSQIGYGIHVGVGMEYFIQDYFSIRGQMRFRDPEFKMKSRYSNSIVNYNGNTYLISADSYNSKGNLDGVTFTLGAVLNF